MTARKSSIEGSESRRTSIGSAVGLVLLGIGSLQFGAGVAKTLFDEISPTAMVWLRLASSAVVLAAIARPRVRGRTRDDWLIAICFGAALGTMNWAIYQSFARIPIGIAVTIEFVGPLAIAAVGFRRPRDLAWVGLAAVGVALLGAERADLDPVGVGFALLAGVLWAGYILLSASTGQRWEGIEGLGIAGLIGVAVLSPALFFSDTSGLADPRILVLGCAVGLLSSVIPYSCELISLRTLSPAAFGVLMSLEPAAAALAGVVVVSEQLTVLQWFAIGCVVAASVGATRAAGRAVHTEPAPD